MTAAPGYLLPVEPEQLDAFQFERLVMDAQQRAGSGEPSAASALLDQALGLWRGAAFAEFADADFARTEALRLEELRRVAVEERVEANLSLGRHAELVGELEGITAANPLAERPRGQLMLALYRCGRQAEALRVYQDYRVHLRDELGIDPSPALARLESEILDQSPNLGVIAGPEVAATVPPAAVPAAAGVTAPDTARRAPSVGVPWRPPKGDSVVPFVGRSDQLDLLRQWLTEALSGTPRVVLLSGEAGIGKSRLVTELIAEARAVGVRPFAGRCLKTHRSRSSRSRRCSTRSASISARSPTPQRCRHPTSTARASPRSSTPVARSWPRPSTVRHCSSSRICNGPIPQPSRSSRTSPRRSNTRRCSGTCR